MRTRRCSLCRKKVPAETALIGRLRAFCCMEHLIEYSRSEAGRQNYDQQRKAEKRETLAKQKTLSDHRKEAQQAFNALIRARDAGRQCISCDTVLSPGGVGGGYDCGHYRSVGSAPHLRFHYLNAHGQCKKCNRYLSGNVVEYRKRLIDRIGLAKVEAIEQDNRQRKYSTNDLQRLKRICRKWQKKFR
jgi:hypothetical protein